MLPEKSETLPVRWIKKHGNARTRLAVLDASDPRRVQLQVIDPSGFTVYRKGQLLEMSLDILTRYYHREDKDSRCCHRPTRS